MSESTPDAPRPSPATTHARRVLLAALWIFPLLHHFGPLAGKWRSAVIGDGTDLAPNLWSLDHALQFLATPGESLYATERVLAPHGMDLVLHTLAPLAALLVAPVAAVAGLFAAYNTLMLLWTVLAGVGACALARRWGACPLGASFAAFLLMLSPALYTRLLNHFSLAAFGVFPLLLALLHSALDALSPARPAGFPRAALALGGVVGALLFIDYNLFVQAGVVLATWLAAWLALALRRRDSRPAWHALAQTLAAMAAPVVAALALFLLLAPVSRARAAGDTVAPRKAGLTLRCDLAFYFRPDPAVSRLLPAPGPSAPGQPAPPPPGGRANPEQRVYLGWAALALAVLGWRHLRRADPRAAGFALLLAVGAFALSLGGSVLFFGKRLALPPALEMLLPFPWLLRVPVLGESRLPTRWAFWVVSLVAPLAGLGLTKLLARCSAPALAHPEMPAAPGAPAAPSPRAFALLAGVATLAALEFAHTPTPSRTYPLPAAYQSLPVASPSTGASADAEPAAQARLLELPLWFAWSGDWAAPQPIDLSRMVWATQHRMPIVSCYLARIGRPRLETLLSEPVLRDLWLLQGGDPGYVRSAGGGTAPLPATPPADAAAWLREHRFTAIVCEKSGCPAKQLAWLDAIPGLSVAHEDVEYRIYRFSNPPAGPSPAPPTPRPSP